MITKIAFVAQPTRDIAASKRFYGELLGLKNSANYEDKWSEFDTPDGKSLALDTYSPEGTGPYVSLETNDIDAELARLRGLGVPVVMDMMDNKVCKMAIVADPAGNKVMLHQIAPERIAAQKAAAAKSAPKVKAKPRTKAKPKAKPAPKVKAAPKKAKAAPKAMAKPKVKAKAAPKAKGGKKKARR